MEYVSIIIVATHEFCASIIKVANKERLRFDYTNNGNWKAQI
jgi:hypothetical protein